MVLLLLLLHLQLKNKIQTKSEMALLLLIFLLLLLWCLLVPVEIIGVGQLERGKISSYLTRFPSSSYPFHSYWTAVAAEEFSLQVKLMFLWPLPDLISSLAHIPFSRHSQYNARAREAAGPREDG